MPRTPNGIHYLLRPQHPYTRRWRVLAWGYGPNTAWLNPNRYDIGVIRKDVRYPTIWIADDGERPGKRPDPRFYRKHDAVDWLAQRANLSSAPPEGNTP